MLAVDRHEGHFAWTGPGRQNDVVGFVLGAFHFHTAGCLDLAESLDHLDVVLLEQELYALVHRLGHTARTIDHLLDVGTNLAVNSMP